MLTEYQVCFEILDLPPEQLLRYVAIRDSGESHNLALVLATRSFPGVRTDSEFNKGKFSGDDSRLGVEQLWLRQQAEAAGVSTTGKWYCRGLADFPGDPTAWIDGRGDVLRIAAEKGMKVTGNLEFTPPDHGIDKSTPGPIVADDIIDSEVDSFIAGDPELLRQREAIRHDCYQQRAGLVDDHALLVHDKDPVVISTPDPARGES